MTRQFRREMRGKNGYILGKIVQCATVLQKAFIKSVTVGGVTNLKGPIKSKSSPFDHDIYQEMKKTHVEEQ